MLSSLINHELPLDVPNIMQEENIKQPIISVSNLSKRYCLGLRRALFYGLIDIGREIFPRKHNNRPNGMRRGEFWALNDVSFQLNRGDSLAIIGANGAGKSTLLKVLYGLIKPDAGRVSIYGRVEALIELGTGFNPILSGRENVYVNAALFGMAHEQVDKVIKQIIEFAGIEEFIDTPVQFYSSGMKARLSYAVAVHFSPDILLVDEVLAVGDMAFQRKCINHMQKYLDAGGSIIFVSHSPYHIQSICNRGIVLEHGKLCYSGTAIEALNYYMESQNNIIQAASGAKVNQVSKEKPVVIEEVFVEPVHSEEIESGEDLRLVLNYKAHESVKDLNISWGFNIMTGDQWVCITGDYDTTLRQLTVGEGKLSCVLPKLPLVSGTYLLKVVILDASNLYPLALYGFEDSPLPFTVTSKASLLTNARTASNQLTVFNVEWN